jgi:hypothetical protein
MSHFDLDLDLDFDFDLDPDLDLDFESVRLLNTTRKLTLISWPEVASALALALPMAANS